MMHKTGGCACGAIRYVFEGEPLFVHACHCTDCQRASGTTFGLTMLVEARDFRVVSGEPGEAALTGGSGAGKQSYFCPHCGGWLFGRTDLRPGVLAIRPGTLDDTTGIVPRAHIWTRSKLPWLELSADVPRFETIYDASALWPEESLRRQTEAARRAESGEE